MAEATWYTTSNSLGSKPVGIQFRPTLGTVSRRLKASSLLLNNVDDQATIVDNRDEGLKRQSLEQPILDYVIFLCFCFYAF